MYIIMFTFEKSNSDVLKEVQRIIPHQLTEITLQSNIIHINYFRSTDRTYAEMFHIWENESEYLNWKTQALSYIEEFEKLTVEHDINYRKYYPPGPNHDWSIHMKLDWNYLIFYEDIWN